MIIESLLDLDFYKLTMLNCVLQKFPDAEVEYKFKCRTPGTILFPHASRIRREINHVSTLFFTKDEIEYLSEIKLFKQSFISFLKILHLDSKQVLIGNEIGDITIKGSWWQTILWETIILSIVNEIYFRDKASVVNTFDKLYHTNYNVGDDHLTNKLKILNSIPKDSIRITDFGTRRRFSRDWQEHVVSRMKNECTNFSGTSNVLLAKKLDLTPIGTMAHEMFMASQNLGPRLFDAQKFTLQSWADVYRGDLGIALSDTYGFDAFLRDFDPYFAKLFDGCRHDSGDPFVWCEKLIVHYEKLNIDPKSKVAVFSDSLNAQLILDLYNTFKGKIKLSFGIGTNLTNDVGLTPLNIVIKMSKCNGQSVAKLSDNVGKTMCDDESYLNYLKKVYKVS